MEMIVNAIMALVYWCLIGFFLKEIINKDNSYPKKTLAFAFGMFNVFAFLAAVIALLRPTGL